MALIQKAFSDIITFSRSSNATRIGPTGLVEYAPHNLLTYSQELGNAAWGTKNGTFTDNAAVAPDGTITATRCVATDADPFVYQSFTFSAQTYTFSIWVKGEGSSVGGYGTIRLGASSSSAITITANWQRVTATFTPSAGTNLIGVEFPEAATVGQTVYLWGAQLSVGPYALDYTPTTSAAVYGPRFDFDPVTLAPKGLLVEEQRQNLLTYSEQFNNAAWTAAASKVSVSANSVTSPDGTVNADTITGDGTSGGHYIGQVIAGVGSGKTLSFYVKAGTNNFIQVFTDYTNNDYANFDLANGAVGSKGLNTGATTITVVGNGWYRCTMVTGDALSQNINFALISSSTASRLQSNTLSTSVHLWGAQLEAGSFATSYIPTLASTVTRSADVASVNTLSPWFNATEGTIYAEYDIIGKTSTFGMASQIDDGTLDNRIVNIGQEASSGDVKLGSFMNSGGSPSVNEYPITSMTVGSVYKLAFAVKSNDAATVANGISILDGTAVVPTGLTTLRLGSRITDGYLSGHLRRIAYYPRRLTNAELQALTA
jgi:hypothetical protein